MTHGGTRCAAAPKRATSTGVRAVEVRGDNEVANSDKRYQNDYLFLVQCRDGKIAHIFEYSNPLVYKTAVG